MQNTSHSICKENSFWAILVYDTDLAEGDFVENQTEILSTLDDEEVQDLKRHVLL